MTSKLRTVLIDPVVMTLTDCWIRPDCASEICTRIGLADDEFFDQSNANVVTASGVLALRIYLDDEGLLRPRRSYFGILPHLSAKPEKALMIAGKAMIAGPITAHGTMTPCPLKADDLAAFVDFYTADGDGIRYIAAGQVIARRDKGERIPRAWVDQRDDVASMQVHSLG